MARQKNKNNGSSKKKQSPIYSVQRAVPRPRVTFDGTFMNGTGYTDNVTTAASGASALLTFDFTNTKATTAAKTTQSVGWDLTSFAGRYTQFRFIEARLTWVPRVAPGVADGGSAITIGYIDNPEIMFARISTLVAADIPAFKSIRNIKTFNAWQGFTYSVPLTRRLPWFNINSVNAYAIDEVERSVQGAAVVAYESINAIALLGQWHMTYLVELKNLNTGIST